MHREISAPETHQRPGLSHPAQAACDDAQLMARVTTGDGSAYAVLVGRYAGRWRALAENMGLDRATAEDVIQEVFVKIWQQAERFDPARARFSTWAHRIVMNRAIDMRRKRREMSLPADYDSIDHRADTSATIAQHMLKQAVHKRLDRLPTRQRQAIVLVNLQDLSNKEAAETMQMTLKAFESLLLRARRKFADILRHHPIDP